MSFLPTLAALAGMLVGLALIPLGLPGLWLIVAIVLGFAVFGPLPLWIAAAAGVAASVAEAAELLVLRRFGRAYGGSRRAFWGAVLGGLAGLFVGLPVPLVGPLVTAFLGTFAGAGVVTYFETRSLERSTRVGWGLVLARTAAVGVKVATGAVIVGTFVMASVL